MKKFILLPILFSLVISPVAFAQVGTGVQDIEPPENIFGCTPDDSLTECLAKIGRVALRIIMVVALLLAAIFIAYAGVRFIIKPEDVGTSKQMIIYAAVGLVIAFIAWALTLMLKRFVLTGEV